MYKILMLFSFLWVLSLVGCIKSDDKIKIGLLLHKIDGTSWETDAKYFSEKAKEIGADIIIRNANKNESLQNQQAAELINSKIDVLIITAQNTNNAAYIVRKAHQNNIKVIAYRRMIKNVELDYFAGFNLKKAAADQAKFILDRYPDKANLIIIEGDKNDENAKLLEQQHMQELDKKIKTGDYHVIYKAFIENWSAKEAAHEFDKAYKLNTTNPDAIISASDGLTTGITESLIKTGLYGNVSITGMDAHLAACQRIINNKQGMTIYKPIKELAANTVSLAISVVKNQSSSFTFQNINNGRSDIKSVIIDPISVTKENIDKVIIKNKVYSKEEVYL